MDLNQVQIKALPLVDKQKLVVELSQVPIGDRGYANARAVINPHVPNGLAVARSLPVQMRGPWMRHVVHQRTISRSGSRAAGR